MDDWRLKAYLDGCFLEYNALRTEIRELMARFYTILQFGSTAVLGLAGVALNFWSKDNVLVAVSFAFFIPTLAFVFIEMMMGQIASIRRTSQYLKAIERKIRTILGDVFGLGDECESPHAIGWETWVAGKDESEDRHFMWIYTFGISFFFFISVVSISVIVFLLVRPSVSTDIRNVVQNHRLGFAIAIGSILLSVEGLKATVWFSQAREIAGSLKVPIFVKINMNWIKKITSVVTNTSLFGSTTSFSGVVLVFIQGLIIYLGFGPRAVVLFFSVVIVGTVATGIRASEKARLEAQSRQPRTWKNAVANAGVATGLALYAICTPNNLGHFIATGAFVGSLAAALSDTLSHELGEVFGGAPRMITTLRRVQPGQNGAVSLVGLIVGLGGAAAVSTVSLFLGLISVNVAIVATLAGFSGNLADSLVGATLERKGWIGNNLVNLCCTSIAAIIAILALLGHS